MLHISLIFSMSRISNELFKLKFWTETRWITNCSPLIPTLIDFSHWRQLWQRNTPLKIWLKRGCCLKKTGETTISNKEWCKIQAICFYPFHVSNVLSTMQTYLLLFNFQWNWSIIIPLWRNWWSCNNVTPLSSKGTYLMYAVQVESYWITYCS